MAVVSVPGALSDDELRLKCEELMIFAPREGAFLELPAGKAQADVIVKFSRAQGSLAFWIESADAASPLKGPLNVLATVPLEDYALRGIPEGTYTIHAMLWEVAAGAPDAQPRTSEELLGSSSAFRLLRGRTSVSFTVKRFEDFVPKYEWKPVAHWHRLPPGLEIVLDLGGSGDRKARIPQPWQWDARVADEAVPKRVPVMADTTMALLLSLMGFSTNTHEVVWGQDDGKHEQVLEVNWTSTQANLFQYSRQIFVRMKKARINHAV
ncbi:unnamed protein product [Polarella glacialis]|uniref:Uncharacterized protein n=1 Tax=Polarella glacialis TaxID=89957 RepID=A0A813L6Q4_POLGL|nr:unnamed protein product [Polarella glacialis]